MKINYLLQSTFTYLTENQFAMIPAETRIDLLTSKLQSLDSATEENMNEEKESESSSNRQESESSPAIFDGTFGEEEEGRSSLDRQESVSTLPSSLGQYSSVYFDGTYAEFRTPIASVMPQSKLCFLLRYSVAMLITKCKEKWDRPPSKKDFDDLTEEIIDYYPSLSTKDIRRKVEKRFLNMKANTSNVRKNEEK